MKYLNLILFTVLQAFLFVSDEKRIDGCCIAEGITEVSTCGLTLTFCKTEHKTKFTLVVRAQGKFSTNNLLKNLSDIFLYENGHGRKRFSGELNFCQFH